jgi:hypothetical protein
LRPIFWVQKVFDHAGRVAMISGVIGLTTQSIALMDRSMQLSCLAKNDRATPGPYLLGWEYRSNQDWV